MFGVRGVAVSVVVLTVVATTAVAVPLSGHREEHPFPSEMGVDEEVRQLLDLKGQVAQRDLGMLKKAHQQDKKQAPTPAAPDHQSSGVRQAKVEAREEETFHLADGNQEHRSHSEERVSANGSPVSRVESEASERKEAGQPQHSHSQVEVDVPAEHIHETLEEDDGHRTLFRHDPSKVSGIRYSPLDLALYIYKTGDEERVTMAIQELIAEGMMSAEEALSYLHSIREHLHYLTQQDSEEEKVEQQTDLAAIIKKSSLPLPLTEMNLGDPDVMLAPEADYEGLMERLRGQDDQYTHYSLEEVIYQLAKIIFKQAMQRGGGEGSERALQEVANLLEKEVARGAITTEAEKKLWDVMVNSLVDSLSETELPSAPGPMMGGSNFRLSGEGSFPLRGSPMLGEQAMKPLGSLLHLSKATTKREAPREKMAAGKKTE